MRVIKRGDGHAPGSLARDAPIRARGHSRFNAVLAPIWNPRHGVDCLLRRLAKRLFTEIVVDADEPLVHGAEDDRRFAAPAMWIFVMIILLVNNRVAHAQFMDDG